MASSYIFTEENIDRGNWCDYFFRNRRIRTYNLQNKWQLEDLQQAKKHTAKNKKKSLCPIEVTQTCTFE